MVWELNSGPLLEKLQSFISFYYYVYLLCVCGGCLFVHHMAVWHCGATCLHCHFVGAQKLVQCECNRPRQNASVYAKVGNDLCLLLID